jgi:hypothetical protein
MNESLSELYRQELYRTLLRPQTPLSTVTQLPRTASLSDLLSPSRPASANTLRSLGMFENWPHPTSVLAALSMSPGPPPANTLSALGLLTPPDPAIALAALAFAGQPRPRQRIAVRPRFTEFRKNLALTPLQFTDGKKKRAGVVSCPNNAYGWMRPNSACIYISRL